MRCVCCLNTSRFSSALLKSLPPGAQFFHNIKSSFTSSDYRLVECLDCGHLFLSSDPVSYYKTVFRSIGVSPSMKDFRIQQFNSIRHSFFDNSNILSALEIGAGSGSYCELLTSSFDTVVGTETSYLPDSSHSDLPFNLISTHPDDDDFLNIVSHLHSTYDLIACFSYLEHLPNPDTLLVKAASLLSDSGKLLIEVPDTDWIIKNGLVNEIVVDHLQYFTYSSFSRLASRCGYRIISTERIWNNFITSYMLELSSPVSLSTFVDSQSSFFSQVDLLLEPYLPDSVIAVWGAGHQSLFICSYTSLRYRTSYVVDSSPAKQGFLTPVSDLPIYSPSYLQVIVPDLIIVACAGYNEEVLAQLRSFCLPSDVALVQENSISLLYEKSA